MLSLFKKKAPAKGLTSVVFTGDGVAFAHVTNPATNPELTCCEFLSSSNPVKEPKRYKDFLDSKSLSGTQAIVVLPEDAYQIILVEKPDVPADELSDALRWKVKDMINFDVEKALIDYVELPEDAYRGRSEMVYAVIAHKEHVERLTGWCVEIGLTPVVVDVPELALLNLTEDLADSEAGLAVFYIGKQNSSINLLSDSALYFTRHLSYSSSAPPDRAGAAVLELQRSMDYYESQIGKPPCVRLMVMPLVMDDDPLMEELRANLPLDIHSLNLENLISADFELPVQLQNNATIAVAAALRTQLEMGGRGNEATN